MITQSLLTLVQIANSRGYTCTAVRFGGELSVRIRRRKR